MSFVKKVKTAFLGIWSESGKLENGRNRLFAIIDMLVAYKLYGASPRNYVVFGFEKLEKKKRATFFTYKMNQDLMRSLNSPEKSLRLLDKYYFCLDFHDLLGREFAGGGDLTPKGFDSFAEKHNRFLVKPRREAQGRGVVYFDKNESLHNLNELREKVLDSPDEYILEEAIEQHPDITSNFGAGLLPVRVVSKKTKGKVSIVMCAVTLGTGGNVVNYHTGGVMAIIDGNTGEVIAPALDKKDRFLYKHPLTQKNILGYQFPNWHSVLELVGSAAMRAQGVGFIGWDIGITKDGAVLIEGNNDPGTYSMLQHTKVQDFLGRLGIRDQVEKCS